MSDHHNDNSNGPEYRDPDLARLLAGPIPDHQPSFWDELSTRITTESNGGPVTPTTLQTEIPAESTTEQEGGIIDLDLSRSNRRTRRSLTIGLAAALLVVFGSVGLFAALSANGDGDASNDVATEGPDNSIQNDPIVDDDPNDEADERRDESGQPDGDPALGTPDDAGPDLAKGSLPDSPSQAVVYNDSVEVVNLGTGEALGTTPDGSAILVVDEYREQPNLGCEGVPELMLYGQDVTTGDRRPLMPEGMTVATGGMRLVFADEMALLNGRPTAIYWTDFCDGVRNPTWSAVMAPDGTITNPQLEAEPASDYFAAIDQGELAPSVATLPGPSYAIQRIGQTIEVASTDPSNPGTWVYGSDVTDRSTMAVGPAGDVVVINEGERTVIWRFRTDERWIIPTGEVFDYQFGRGGEYLFLNYLFPEPAIGLLNFSGGPAPVYHVEVELPCSGEVDLGELQTQDRLPPALAEVLASIDEAAANCDWVALTTLAGESFLFGLGGENPASAWPMAQAQGLEPALELRLLLRTPVARIDGRDGPLFIWPAAATKSCEELTAEDRASLLTLGIDDEELAGHCDDFSSYVGIRTGFSETGEWQYLVSGD